ncbi:MAG: M20/M25/M40 family metallo-hydrolase [Chloroflexi bacterium]|jgi:acetylornithine deacetylase/succinyl-diaminopimelate desuccinylase-like protein|nr:M20/M25/M40 family metallo-hydrolase [Chloroflexota bacterium]
MNRIGQIAQDPNVQTALASFAENKDDLLEMIVAIQQIPSPTFEEKERAAFIEARFLDLCLQDVEQDSLHNVYGRLPGRDPTSAMPVIISAHSDTVFPSDTDLTVTQDGRYFYGPGIGDNAAGVAGLLILAQAIQEFRLKPAADLWFLSNVGEEGLGDLRGMRAAVQRFGQRATYIVVEGGSFGQITHEAIGVQRFRIEISTPGGHSWGNFGAPSATHELGHLIAAIDGLRVPASPRTSFNVGIVEGGTTINSIAASASLLLDLRSEEMEELERLVAQVRNIVDDRQKRAKKAGRTVEFRMEQVGNRPAGRISRDNPLVRLAESALHYVGCSPITYIAGSTDANIPLSQGLRSVCIGLARSGQSHRQDEFIEPADLPLGMKQLLLLTLASADF